jgi:hypothetical protein
VHQIQDIKNRTKDTYKGSAGSGTVLATLGALEIGARALGALSDLNLLGPEPLGLGWAISSASEGPVRGRAVDERPRLGEAAVLGVGSVGTEPAAALGVGSVGTEPAAVDERPREDALVGVVSCLLGSLSIVLLILVLTTVWVDSSISSSNCLGRIICMISQNVDCHGNPCLMKK